MGRGRKCVGGSASRPLLGGDTLTLLLLLVFPFRAVALKSMGVNVLEGGPLQFSGVAFLLAWSELLERDLDGVFFFGLSAAVDFERGLPILGKSSADTCFLAEGIPSPDNLLSRNAIGDGELEILPGETRPLCLRFRKVLQNGLLELLKLKFLPSCPDSSKFGVRTMGP